MTKVALKGLALHKTRAVLTTLAVVIGVAMISGAYVVSDTMLSAANSLSGSAYDNTDAVVTKKTAFSTGSDTIGGAVPRQPDARPKGRPPPHRGPAPGEVGPDATPCHKKGKDTRF